MLTIGFKYDIIITDDNIIIKNVRKRGDKVIKELRNRTNMTQEQLAEKLGIRQSTVAMWETGETVPRLQTIFKLSEVLECDVSELIKSFKVTE